VDINDLFDGIMKSINQFADEIAEQRLQEKNRKPDEVQRIGVRMRRISRRKRSGVWWISRKGSDRDGSANALKAT